MLLTILIILLLIGVGMVISANSTSSGTNTLPYYRNYYEENDEDN